MRAKTRLLTQQDVARLIDYPTAIRVVREAFKRYALKQAVMPAKVYLPLPGNNDFRAMPAYLRQPAVCGLKWVNVHPQNPKHGLPSVMAVIVINDPANGIPLAIMDGLLITQVRTAAASAVAAQALARAESQRVGLIGCGAQAQAQLLALFELFAVSVVDVWGYQPGEARLFCARMRRRFSKIAWHPAATLSKAACDADILITLTPSRKPLIKRAWLCAGAHVNAVGADAPGKQELEPAILNSARVVVDDYEQSIHGGELNVPVARGQFDPRKIHASLGDVLLGRKKGRASKNEVTVFDSTGLAIHDVALGFEILRRARRLRVGRDIALM